MIRNTAVVVLAGLVVLSGILAGVHWSAHLQPRAVSVVPNAPGLPPPSGAVQVYHLGHSLVGRDMPAMLAQLAQAAGYDGHTYHSQLGWGASLREHWYPDVAIGGFDLENDHPRFRPAHEAVTSGDYDVVILTEMVELRDAIRHHDSPAYFREWARAAQRARPDVRIYLYETWHARENRETWLNRLEADPDALWKGRVLAATWADDTLGPVHLIPAGRALAAFARALEEQGGVEGLADETGLFARHDDGALDTIHLNDLGAYLVALTHFAVLYHHPVAGLPHALLRADGSAADAPSPEAAQLMQQVVWDVVRATPYTGLSREPGS